MDEFSQRPYTVLFERPTVRNVQIRVTVSSAASVTDPTATVRQAVMAYANNQTREIGFIIGRDISPFELAGIINQVAPDIFVTLVELANRSDTPTYQSTTLTINTNQLPILASSGDIIVVVA